MSKTFFQNLDVELVDGHRVLGSVLGSSSACEKFKVEKATEVPKLLPFLKKNIRGIGCSA